MATTSYNIANHKHGDTWDGLTFTLTREGTPITLTNAIIRMWVKNLIPDDPIQLKLDTEDEGGIEITDGANGIFVIGPVLITLAPGNYEYDIEIEFEDGTIKTYIGGNWVIDPDITDYVEEEA